jgi:hypothetical protein
MDTGWDVDREIAEVVASVSGLLRQHVSKKLLSQSEYGRGACCVTCDANILTSEGNRYHPLHNGDHPLHNGDHPLHNGDSMLTPVQLAEILGRNYEGLRQRFLLPMVQHGLLRLRYPNTPSRVDQAYTTVLNEEIS